MQSVISKLDGLESDFARTNLEVLRMQKRLVEYKAVVEKIEQELKKSGVKLTDKSEIVIRDGWVYVDDERMSRELSERCIAIFEKSGVEQVDSRGTSLRWHSD